ncbi:periplasmic divalent manganese/zinc-binding lipoprotein [Spirochaetia bacterium]|nr:periplasmic divalent manganese/zinc-binding lipoprotein [Spirochaetia bacterium]
MRHFEFHKKNIILALFLPFLLWTVFAACERNRANLNENTALSVVTTIFPPYDFVRAIAGDEAVRLTMLLKPGAESHSYEPTPQDIIAIQRCDVFIYVGGESENWVNRVLDSLDPAVLANKRLVRLMDCVEVVEEEIVEGMEEADDEEEGIALDEHVWTSPQNAKRIVEKITAALCEAAPTNAALYREKAAAYIAELETLDAEFRAIAASGRRKTLVFADRFPFRYFTATYGLDYYAAFPGCSTETEANAATVAFLINKIRGEQIPVVFHIEFSNGRMADAIGEATGAKKRLLHSAHNVSRDELGAGITYLDIMRSNADVLREALQ